MINDLPVGEPVEGPPARPLEAGRLPTRVGGRPPRHSPDVHARRLQAVHAEGSELFANVAAKLYSATHGDSLREQVWTYLPYGPFESAAVFEAWLAERAPSTDPIFHVVFDAAIPIGLVAFMAIRPEGRVVELGHIWFVPGAQAQGLAGVVCGWMLAEAFAKGYRRVEWKCDALNARSRRAALALGFSEEGVFRQHFVVKGRNRDTAWFSMLDGEWAERD